MNLDEQTLTNLYDELQAFKVKEKAFFIIFKGFK